MLRRDREKVFKHSVYEYMQQTVALGRSYVMAEQKIQQWERLLKLVSIRISVSGLY